MLYVVEVRRDRASMTETMGKIREWLDGKRSEPDAFRCTTQVETVIFRLEFSAEGEAKACAEGFDGRLLPIG